MDSDNGVSLVVVSIEPIPPPLPPKRYVLTLDERHAKFLLALLTRVQTGHSAGQDSFDIFTVLHGTVPRIGELKLLNIDRLNNVEIKYREEL